VEWSGRANSLDDNTAYKIRRRGIAIYSLVAKKLIPLYEFLYEFLLGGV